MEPETGDFQHPQDHTETQDTHNISIYSQGNAQGTSQRSRYWKLDDFFNIGMWQTILDYNISYVPNCI